MMKRLVLTMGEVQRLRDALAGLDGPRGGQPTAATFKLGATRLKLAINLNKLDAAVASFEKARVKIVLECKEPSKDRVDPGDPGWERFDQAYQAMLQEGITVRLEPLTPEMLNLDVNEIPVEILSALTRLFPSEPKEDVDDAADKIEDAGSQSLN